MGRKGGSPQSTSAREGGTNTARSAGASAGETRAEAPAPEADVAADARLAADEGGSEDTSESTEGETVAEGEEQPATGGTPPAEGRAEAGWRGARRRGSRRFPRFTRDTARPEGGGRALGAEHAAPYRQWPLLAVCAGVLLGLLVAVGEFRVGCLLIGVSLLAGAALRWVLPSVGMLAVRSRFTDLVTYGVLGLVIVLLATMAQPDPWITVPFLEDVVHFSIR